MRWTLLIFLSTINTAWADPVWHCSRNVGIGNEQHSYISTNDFSIASLNSSTDVIGVSISDLIDVYSGVLIRIGGVSLSACFMPSDSTLSKTALTSLGLQPAVIQALSRKSAIVQSNLFLVSTEAQMLTCIEDHFPAVGYLNDPTETDKVQPCF